MKNGNKTENKSGEILTAHPLSATVAKIQIFYGNGYNLGPFGLPGLKFFDLSGNVLNEVGSVGSNNHKEIVLAADERIIGVVGRENPQYPNFY